jgi:hypothetical protein
MKHIYNRYLPTWLHRLCNGILGAAGAAALASLGLSRFPPGHLLHRLAALLLYLSLPIGIFLALIARRFSIVEGLAGREGYDELNDHHDNDKT